MGLCEAFTCVKVEVFLPSGSVLEGAQPGGSLPAVSISHGWASTGFTSSKSGVTGSVSLWGICQDWEDFPMKGPVDVPHPPLLGTRDILIAELGKAAVKQTSVLCVSPWSTRVLNSHPDDLEVGDFLFLRKKIMVLVTILRKRSTVGRKAQITKKPGM